MAEGLVHFDEQALELFRVVVRAVDGHLDLTLTEFFLIEDGDGAIDADCFVDTGDEKEHTDVWILVQVVVGLEQSVPGDIGNDEVPVVDDLYESGLAAFG